MFASRNHNQANQSERRKPARGDSPLGKKTAPQHNPLWQSLATRSGVLQPKLTIGQADDQYEREADQVVDQVMRASAPQSRGCGLSITPVTGHQAQRKCSECEEEEGDTLLRKESNGVEAPATAPPIVHETLSSPGQPLDAVTRAYFEPRFRRSFANVRLHTSEEANAATREVSASAFTVGDQIAFDAGQYAPHTETGRRLLAHELTHVVQQSGTAISRSTHSVSSYNDSTGRGSYEVTDRNPGRIATQKPRPGLQRKMKVDNAGANIPAPTRQSLVQTNAQTVQDYLRNICRPSNAVVDPSTGDVTIDQGFCTRPRQWTQPIWGLSFPLPFTDPSPAEKSGTPKSCSCLCDISSSENLWTIEVSDDIETPETDPDNEDAGMSGGGTGGRITVPSPNSTKVWGAATETGGLVDFDAWELLIHELCGHARLHDQGNHAQDNPENRAGKFGGEVKEVGHQIVVDMENEVRGEHNLPLRAKIKGPYCGESFFRERKGATEQWPTDPADPRFTYLYYCQRWREPYNKERREKNLPEYKIDESIP
jgi:hypothetical protein